MATRTFCDHCGNTVRSPRQFAFGPKPPEYNVESDRVLALIKAQGNAGIYGQAAQAAAPIVQAGVSKPPTHPIKTIDLCDTCVPIWYQRLDALCKASDPEPEVSDV